MTETCGGTISGYCATGITSSDSSAGDRRDDGDDDRQPRPVDEDRGEHRLSSGSSGGGAGLACTGMPGRSALQPLDDDLLAARQALVDDHVGPLSPPGLPPHRGLAVLDDEDIDALLVGDQRRLRHHDLLLRLAGLEIDRAPAGRRSARPSGLGIRRADQHRVGRAVDA